MGIVRIIRKMEYLLAIRALDVDGGTLTLVNRNVGHNSIGLNLDSLAVHNLVGT